MIGCHVVGEQGDVIVGGELPPPGATMYETKRFMERGADHVRRLLIREPRGSVARQVNLLVPTITGRAWITGSHSYFVDPTDP